MKILLASDDVDSGDILAYGLRRSGFSVVLVSDSALIVRDCENEDPDVILLDRQSHSQDCLEVCREIRSESSVPIVVMAGYVEDSEIARTLEVGADDYVQKPMSFRQLKARVRAVSRRVQKEGGTQSERGELRIGETIIRFDSREVAKDGRQVPLTSTECKILQCLAAQQSRVVPFADLIWFTWGGGEPKALATRLRTHISRLRNKLKSGPEDREYIRSVPGLGYKLQI